MEWGGAPDSTQGFALIMHDPDAPDGDFTHWVVFDIRAGVRCFDAGAAPIQVAVEGINDAGNVGYHGPCPPTGHGPHRYVFELYALDVSHLALGEGASREEVETKIEGHILAKAKLTGTYQRQG